MIKNLDNRPKILDDLLSTWIKVQGFQHVSLREFGKENTWPDVNTIFYHPKVQVGLVKVRRWQADKKLNIRPQNLLEYTFGLIFLAYEIFNKANEFLLRVDKELIFKACLVNNIPESLSLVNVPYAEKSIEQDVKEYDLYCQLIISLSLKRLEIPRLEQIYLLQFCSGDIAGFPDRARDLMNELKREYYQEILWLKFLKNLEYLLYALDQYDRLSEKELIKRVVKVQLPIISALKDKIPYLRQCFWIDEINSIFANFS